MNDPLTPEEERHGILEEAEDKVSRSKWPPERAEAWLEGVRWTLAQWPVLAATPEHEDRTDCWCEPTVGWPGHPLGLVHRDPARADTATLVEAARAVSEAWTDMDEDEVSTASDAMYAAVDALRAALAQPTRADTAAMGAVRRIVDEGWSEYVDHLVAGTSPSLVLDYIKRDLRAALEATDD